MTDHLLDVGVKGFKTGTNILEVNVPDHIRKKARSGIDWVDDAVGGFGWTPTTCCMLTGTPGAGKTTLLLQLADAITGIGHVCLFNSGEESLYQVRLTTERLRIKHGFLAAQKTNTLQLLANAKKILQEKVNNQVVNGLPRMMFLFVDSLQCMDDGKYGNGMTNGTTPVRVCKQLTEFAKNNNNVVVVWIGQVNKNGVFSGKNAIKHACDMHMHLFIDDNKRSETFGERIFTVYKNRFGSAGATFILGMDGERGLYKKGSIEYCK